MKEFRCSSCGRIIKGSGNYKQHLQSNCINKSRFLKEDGTTYHYSQFLEVDGKYECPVCHKLFIKGGIVNHYTHMHTEQGIHNKLKRANQISQGMLDGTYKTFKGKTHSIETKRKISKSMKGNKNYNVNKTGRGIKGTYKGFWCASTYELAYVIYCLDHNIQIERNTKGFPYEFKGRKHLYYPDFIVNNEYVEIKGFWKEEVDIKASAVDKPIKILYFKDMDYIFSYIKEKYNKVVDKNIQELYEK